MNNKNKRFTIIIFSLLFIIFLITNNKTTLTSINFSISIWKDNIFPTLFPFFVVSNVLMEYGFINIISPIFKTLMTKIYNLPSSCSFVLISSLFSGFPSGSKLTTDLLKDNYIDNKEAQRLIAFTHYSNPLFIITFIGTIIFNNNMIGIIILISHIISGLITGYIFNHNKKINTIKSFNSINNNNHIGKVLSNSIMDSLNTLFLLLGIVTIFTLISSFITTIFDLNEPLKSILSGILEMTQGIKNISNLNIPLYFKIIVCTFFISFGGISVHLQVISIISPYNIKYKPFFLARILHGIIAIGFVSILYVTFLYGQ